MVTEEMKRANLPDQVVYCVSRRALRDSYKDFLDSVNLDDDSREMALVTELMQAVFQRRGGASG